MTRLYLGCLMAQALTSVAMVAASANFLTAKELYCSPVPRERHGKSGVAKAKRKARQYKRRRAHHGRA
ncbi:hypothetical secreted protein [Pseudomonas knackmussii B13]|uniref:Hypothetical secreted protein n=1 Tax=Pseudomonas knackmussii (strain DSM 6978 / CCUG 54928 / LMG 23759 / B13) TaxID=1301098 RepID=A0A024HCB0_PSEKB|nr:hypothetical protein [Pseudomonas knackmussii]CDF82132.1 hypothetical secreted protein [Pseudomonas knackmussii B13]